MGFSKWRVHEPPISCFHGDLESTTYMHNLQEGIMLEDIRANWSRTSPRHHKNLTSLDTMITQKELIQKFFVLWSHGIIHSHPSHIYTNDEKGATSLIHANRQLASYLFYPISSSCFVGPQLTRNDPLVDL